ncbi:MAG: hypothetical protein ACLGXA_23870 [Acidobacteriota bacterium]
MEDVLNASEAERLVFCFDPHATHAEGPKEILIVSPRYGRLRRTHPLLATSPAADGIDAAWAVARHNLFTCRDRSVQLALATYQHRIRVEARIAVTTLRDPAFDLCRHGHDLLDRYGEKRSAIVVSRRALFIRSLPPDPAGYARFEFGNTFLLPISEDAMLAESKTLW